MKAWIGVCIVFVLLAWSVVALAGSPATVPFVDSAETAWDSAETVTIADLELDIRWYHDGKSLHIMVTSDATGWMAIGFVNTGGRMNQANMLIAHSHDGEWIVENHVGRGLNHRVTPWPGQASYSFSKVDTSVTMHIQYPLVFPSGFAIGELVPGPTYDLIVARSDRSGLRNHGRQSRRTIPFTLEGVIHPG